MVGRTLGGKYRIVRLLGEGGMGSVYEAEHTRTGRHVALKVISGDLVGKGGDRLARFEREARAAAAVDTEHVPHVLDAGTDEEAGVPYLALELLQGEDLQALLSRAGFLPPDIALRIVAQVCVGLQHAHEAQVVHRDIKPSNLFLARRPGGGVVVKILDFGIAKLGPDAYGGTDAATITRTGYMLGSPLYMSPEQARGLKHVDHLSDLWSLGVVLYRALAGRAPHAGIEAMGDLIMAICQVPARPVRALAPWVAPEAGAIVHRALQIDPSRRFPSAMSMREAILALVGDDELREDVLVPLAPEIRERATSEDLATLTAPEASGPPTKVDTTTEGIGFLSTEAAAPASPHGGPGADRSLNLPPSRDLVTMAEEETTAATPRRTRVFGGVLVGVALAALAGGILVERNSGQAPAGNVELPPPAPAPRAASATAPAARASTTGADPAAASATVQTPPADAGGTATPTSAAPTSARSKQNVFKKPTASAPAPAGAPAGAVATSSPSEDPLNPTVFQ